MERTVGGRTKVSYTFDDHALQDRIPVAREPSIYANGERLWYSFDRKLALNDPLDENASDVDPGIEPEPARLNRSSMTVENIADGLYHVGRNENYSTFFSTDEGVIAFGMAAGFGDRLTAYREQTHSTQPLTHAVIADHHRDKMAGAVEAASEGATLVTTQDAAARVRARLSQSNPKAQVHAVDSRSDFGGLQILSLATAHASSVLIAYEPSSGTFVQTGHFSNPYANKAGFADYTTLTLHDALAPYAIRPQMILSAESRKAEGWDAFVTAVEEYDPTPCHGARPICGASRSVAAKAHLPPLAFSRLRPSSAKRGGKTALGDSDAFLRA